MIRRVNRRISELIIRKEEKFSGACAMQTINKFFDKAGEYTNIKSERLEVIKQCDNLLTVRLPLVRDDGSIEMITGFRSHHHNYKLPTKGGLMISHLADRDLVESLGLVMTIKQSVLDLPHGGAYGAIRMDKNKYSKREIEFVVRRYTVELAKKQFIGGSIDIINPERNCEAQEMNWIKNTYQTIYGQSAKFNPNSICTGKTVSQGGVEKRVELNALSYQIVLQSLLEDSYIQNKFNINPSLKGQKIVAQRWGTHTYNIVQQLIDKGAILVGAIDLKGNSVYDEKGLDPLTLFNYYKQNKKSLPAMKQFNKQHCDIMLMYETEVEQEVKDINCKILVECSNTPINFNTDQMLNSKGTLVVPDVLIHSGGAITSYIEWLKSLENVKPGRMTKDWEQISKINLFNVISTIHSLPDSTLAQHQLNQLKGPQEWEIVENVMMEILTKSISETLSTSKNYNISLREACYINGIKKVNANTRIR